MGENRKIYAALLGAGTVGSGVYKLAGMQEEDICLKTGAHLEIKKILVRNPGKVREGIPQELFTDSWQEILEDPEIQIVIEVMGGIEPARTYVEEAMKLRDELAAATGYDKISQESYSQSSSSRGFGTEMTHEDAGELSGRFTALQIAGEEIKNAMLNTLAVAQAISSFAKDNNTMLTEIRNLMISSNGHLESINKYTKLIYKFGDKLDEIAKNTKSI